MTALTDTRVRTMLESCGFDASRVRASELHRRALAHDASHFILVPSAIVAPRSAEEVARLLRATAQAGIPLTFRSGGTSLSGQAGTGYFCSNFYPIVTIIPIGINNTT